MSDQKTIITWNGVTVDLQPMETAPRDKTGILVLLESESLGRRWHSAVLHPNISLVGHQFAFDLPKMIGWIPWPEIVGENL